MTIHGNKSHLGNNLFLLFKIQVLSLEVCEQGDLSEVGVVVSQSRRDVYQSGESCFTVAPPKESICYPLPRNTAILHRHKNHPFYLKHQWPIFLIPY